MKKFLILVACSSLFLTSCVSNKEHAALEAKQKTTQDLLNTATVKLNDCLSERSGLSAENNALKSQVTSLNATNGELINQIGDFTDLTIKGASNLEKSLESMKEKDLTINKLRDAITRRDSVNLALVQSLKGVLGDMNDTDIEINVEKGVVFVSISDKLLFKSGSINISEKAKEVLGKIAMVVNNKPDFEFLVEGHTDSKTISTNCIKDNWDLSVLRATTVVRILQDDFGVSPARMTAGGRSQYVPKSANETAEGRAKNRRTRIVILPKLDQFYTMIEDGLKNPAIN
ncbi:MAG: OmpA family protein [Flavobacteriaceae bacterium]|jgi:chemotaxis protein MotB|nr:cell envelope biogenesis protein OmpA [uncultured bacterium]MBT3871342.1 OmpA family protein [Flavobacteriaceae bacterium]MBT3920487.1 OmpA family protein [Flavobacteriaceae bacterium]MBT6705208.1 OmpA family protein [Flavobacteriaceae bacterium]